VVTILELLWNLVLGELGEKKGVGVGAKDNQKGPLIRPSSVDATGQIRGGGAIADE